MQHKFVPRRIRSQRSRAVQFTSQQRKMRYAFTAAVRAAKMEEYLHYHDHIWPEVCRGLRAAGVTQLTIFRAPQTTTLFLYVTTAGATDLGEATGPRSRYREDPKCQEWEELMDADFHGGWTALDEVHASDREWVGALVAVSRILYPAGPQRLGASWAFCRGRVANSHSPLGDLLQPESRSHVVLRQTPAAYGILCQARCAPNSEPDPPPRSRSRARRQSGPDAATPMTLQVTTKTRGYTISRRAPRRLCEVRPVAHQGPLHPHLEPPQRQLPRGCELDEFRT